VNAPAPAWRSTLALLTNEFRLLGRRPENLLVALVVPAAVLVFFGAIGLPGAGPARARLDDLVPASIAIAIIAIAFVNLGIATAYERSYGVLKRLGCAPIARRVVVLAKIGSVFVVVALSAVLLIVVALVMLGWRPAGSISAPLLLIAIVLGTAVFAGLGLTLAGAARAEAALAVANGVFVGLLLVGGTIVPASELPGALGNLARALPSSMLVDALKAGLGSPTGDVAPPLAVLGAWAAISGVAATRTFRWD